MDLLKINVNDFAEKKNGLTYLSWAHAWAKVLEIDPQATWEWVDSREFPDQTLMVKTTVKIKDHEKSCWLPVMDHRNKPIPSPNAFAINTAIMRCMTKAISMHGLGLYIYAGEDLPMSEEQQDEEEQNESKKKVKHFNREVNQSTASADIVRRIKLSLIHI